MVLSKERGTTTLQVHGLLEELVLLLALVVLLDVQLSEEPLDDSESVLRTE